MSTSISNGYDEGTDTTDALPPLQKDDGSVTYKAEVSASVSASASESSNINNTYSFNLSLASLSLSASIEDSTNIGAFFSVACGIPSDILSWITPPARKAWLNRISTKMCLTYEYIDTIHHCGESLSLRAHKLGIDPPIAPTEYGTQQIVFAGGDRIDINASQDKSLEASSSLKAIKGVMAGVFAAQATTLALGAGIALGDNGSSGFRGNASDDIAASIGITFGAIFLAVIPMIAMMTAGTKASSYNSENLKGEKGSETPNDTGILLDACDGVEGGKFTLKGKDVVFQAGGDLQNASSIKFKNNDGSITMNGAQNCSFGGEDAGVFLNSTSIQVACGGATRMSMNSSEIEIKQNDNAVKLSQAIIQAGSLMITSRGASVPGATFTIPGVNMA